MKKFDSLDILILIIILFATIASAIGIFYDAGNGSFEYTSIHGRVITIYGYGLYQYMSADVAIQGIAQDYITLFAAIPMLVIFYIKQRNGSLINRLIISGIIGYFMVTYFFYLSMGMYNQLFLVYVILAGSSFFAFINSIGKVDKVELGKVINNSRSSFPAWVLIIIPIMIGILWLSIIVPPLLDGSIYPTSLDHYTTLIVQGYDLGILLPASFIIGYLLLKKDLNGYMFGSVYLVFLSFLMLALIAKIVAMGLAGVPVGPPIVLIPLTWGITITAAYVLLRKTKAPVITEAFNSSL
jgi:hypothetical protein